MDSKITDTETQQKIAQEAQRMEEVFARFLCVRKSRHGFDYIQSKAQYAVETLKQVQDALEHADIWDFMYTSNYEEALI